MCGLHLHLQNHAYYASIMLDAFVHLLLGSVKYAQKFAQNAFENFPKISPIMLKLLPIMLDYANSNYNCEICIYT